jgi:RNA polymerase sigma factor (sigma-70 family)
VSSGTTTTPRNAFQATFLVLARRAASVVPRDKLGHWLYGVAYRTAVKARAMRARRRVREVPVSEVPEPGAVREDHLDDLLSRLDRELGRLPEKYRIPIVLCELEGMSHREAAERLGWPIGTVSGRLSRAKAMLTRRLSRPGMALPVGSLAVLLARDAASAGMPTGLIGATVRAASLLATGQAVTAGAVSAEVAALAGRVQRGMMIMRLKMAAATLLMVGMVAAGIGVLAQGQDGGRRANDGGPSRQRPAPRKEIPVLAYKVGDLLVPPGFSPEPYTRAKNAPERKFDMKPLTDLITSTLAKETWKENGGNIGSITPLPELRTLLIRHNDEVQNRVKGLLDLLRRLQEAQAANVGMETRPPSRTGREAPGPAPGSGATEEKPRRGSTATRVGGGGPAAGGG